MEQSDIKAMEAPSAVASGDGATPLKKYALELRTESVVHSGTGQTRTYSIPFDLEPYLEFKQADVVWIDPFTKKLPAVRLVFEPPTGHIPRYYILASFAAGPEKAPIIQQFGGDSSADFDNLDEQSNLLIRERYDGWYGGLDVIYRWNGASFVVAKSASV